MNVVENDINNILEQENFSNQWVSELEGLKNDISNGGLNFDELIQVIQDSNEESLTNPKEDL